jgi:hypothetical protein
MKKVIICIVAIIAMSLSTANAGYFGDYASVYCRYPYSPQEVNRTTTGNSFYYGGMFYLSADAYCNGDYHNGAECSIKLYSQVEGFLASNSATSFANPNPATVNYNSYPNIHSKWGEVWIHVWATGVGVTSGANASMSW